MIIKLTYLNDIRRADELAFIHEHLILNLLSEKHFASLN